VELVLQVLLVERAELMHAVEVILQLQILVLVVVVDRRAQHKQPERVEVEVVLVHMLEN
jgi:hypothetical protein